MKTSLLQSKRFVLTLTLSMCCVAFSVLILGLAIAFNKAPNNKSTNAQYIYGNNSIVKLEVVDDITLEDDTIEKLQPKIKVTSTGKQGEFGALVLVTSQNVIFDYTFNDQKHSFATIGKDINLTNSDMYSTGYKTIIDTITDIKGLMTFRDEVNNGTDYSGLTVHLLADIDLNGGEWEPIGKSSGNSSITFTKFFKGTFDGNNHIISNFQITEQSTYYYLYKADSIRRAHGFFAFVEGATIKNLCLDNVTIKLENNKHDSYGVGVLVGYSEGSLTIENCTVNNSSICYDYKNCFDAQVGGLVGWINAIIFISKELMTIDDGKSGNINFSFCSFINSSITCTNTKDIGRYVGGLYCYPYAGTHITKSFVIDNCMVVAKFEFKNTSSNGRIYLFGIGPPPIIGSENAQVKKTYENLTYTGENIYIYHLLGKNDIVTYDDYCRYYENDINKKP